MIREATKFTTILGRHRIAFLIFSVMAIALSTWLVMSNSMESNAATTTTYGDHGDQDDPEMYLDGQRAWCCQRTGHHFPGTGVTYTYDRPASNALCFALYYGPGGPGWNEKGWITDAGDFNFKHAVWHLSGCGDSAASQENYPDVWTIVNAANNAGTDGPWKNYASIWKPSDNYYQELVVCGAAKGSFHIKKSAVTPSSYQNDGHTTTFSVEGAKYGVWDNSNCSGDPIKTLTIGSNGKSGSTGDLDPGTYYLKETKVPTCGAFASDTRTHPVKVESGDDNKEVTVDVNNKKFSDDLVTGRIKARKVNKATGQACTKGGFTFTLYKSNSAGTGKGSQIGSVTTEAGQSTVEFNYDLAVGTYYVQETGVPTPFIKDDRLITITISLNSDKDGVKFSVTNAEGNTTSGDTATVTVDDDQYGHIKVFKYSAATNKVVPQAGFKFKLYQSDKTTLVPGVNDAITGVAGSAFFTDSTGQPAKLALGTYYVKEYATPNPWDLDETPVEVTLTASGNNGDITNGHDDVTANVANVAYVVKKNKQHAYLEVIKKNTATTNNVTKASCKFEVYKQNANYSLGKSGNLKGVAVTGDSSASHITTDGAAVFMVPNASGNPSDTPAALTVANTLDANDGYYEVYEVAVAEPFWRNAARYRVKIEADGETGKTKATITAVDGGIVYKNGKPANGNSIRNEAGLKLSNGPSALNDAACTTPIEIPNTPYGHIKVIKKNTATATTVTKKEFKFNLYKQNKAKNLPHTAANLVGVALTSQGVTNKSGTRVLGEAIFMEPDANGNPTTTPAKLAVVNWVNADDGYYDIVEVSVAEPFWMNDDTYQVTLKAADDNGKTKSDIRCIGTNPIVFKNGKPVTGNVINDEAGIVVSDCHVAEPTRNQNTTPLEIGDAPYGHIKVIKKNTATAKNVTKKEFKFNLYRQNQARNLPHTAANLVGVALTSQGTTNKSGTQVLGEALFMVPDASGNPTTTPAELAIVNYVYADEGYYDIVEVSVAEPFWKNNDIYQVTLKAANANGLTQSDIGCIGTDPIVFRNGKPVASGVINNEGGIAVVDCHVAEPTRNQNTTPVEIGDAPYGHIKVIKKNTATTQTVTKKEFKFNLYRQNKARNLPHTAAYLIGVAVTSQGSTNKSGTQVPGEALFMVPDANGNPTTTPVELAIVNYVYADEGYYDIVETSVADPFWLNDDTYQVTLKAADSNGKTKSDIGCIGTNPVVFKNGKPIMGNYIADEMGVVVADCHVAEPTRNENTTPTEIGDAPYAHLKAIKKNVATGGTVTKREFRFALYKQNADRNLARTPANLIGVAVTSNGKTKSGTDVPGEAVFMVPNADGTPSNKPVELPVRNRVYSDEGYYDVYETSVVAPFWPTENRYQVTIDAADNEGATKAAIAVPELTATLFKNGQPVTEIAAEAGIKVPDGTTQAIREQTNTTPIEIGNDQYAYIQVIKKNRELGKSGNTVGQDGFRFKLYDTLANAKNQTNWLEEIRTDNTGKARFGTQLPVKGTARTDPSQGNLRVRIKTGEDDNKRNDGVYYVRESGVRYPYNISNTIYRFTITADGDEGIVKYSVSAANFTEHNNEFGDTNWHDYWTNVTTSHAVVSVHDGVVSDLDGPVKNVCDTTLEDAPQYGRATITKRDAEDGSLQRGAEYQVYTLTDVRYASQGGSFNGTGAANNERTPVPVAFPDTVTAKAPKGYTKKKAPTEDVNTGLQLRHSENTDVVTSTVIDAGGSSWNEGTGAVTVVKPIQFTRADGSTFDTIVTDENGEATTGWLPIDGTGTTTYYLVEVKTSNGRVINGEPIPFTLKINIDTALSEISANPSVVTVLQDCESLVTDTDYSNIVNTLQQKDRPNGITIRKTIAKSPANEEGGVLPNATIGFWKEEDDIKVTPEASDGTYSYDAIVIRTSHNADLRPYVHQRVQGGEFRVNALPEGYRLELTSTESDEEPIQVTQAPFTMTTSHDYTIAVYDADDKPVAFKGDTHIGYEEGQRIEMHISSGVGVAVEMTSEAIARRDASISYRSDLDAWVATDLKAGTSYEVEFGRKIVKVIETSENGGHVWFGRYSNGQYDNNHEAMWFNDGWLDQGAMPTHDRCIITSADMFVENANKFTTNTTPLCGTNDDLRTTNHKAWLQDTATQSTYAYEILTSSDGTISHKRIGAGMYVLAEIKPPVDTAHHVTWLVDTKPHYFTVDDTTGYIKDTDDTRPEYDATTHQAQAHSVNVTQDFGLSDQPTKLRISKKEASGGDEIVGAELILTAGNGDVIDRWISTSEPRYIEGLEPGRYRLTEYMTPKVYEKAESIEFNLLPTGVEQHVTMYDSPISINAEIDKRQEIAFPLDPRDEANGDHKNNAKAQDNELGNYSYSLDFRSKSNTWTDEFTVTDPLEPANDGYANLVSIVTPQAFQDYDGKMNVWYKTNKTDNNYRDLTDGGEAPAANEGTAAADSNVQGESESTTAGSGVSDEDAELLGGVTVAIGGKPIRNFDIRNTLDQGRKNASIDVTNIPEIKDYLPAIDGEDVKNSQNLPVFSNLPETWKADLKSTSEKETLDADGNINGIWTVIMRISDDTHAYEYGFDYTSGSKSENKGSNRRPWLSYKANATLSDNHENDWLYDDQGMAADTDGDCRVISYDGWRLWEQDIPTTVAKELNVANLNLAEDEIITGFRFEYGRVEVGFTTRDNDSEDWNRALLKDQHDDLDDITGLSSRSFQASQTSADAAVSRLDILSNRFTTGASIAAEDMVQSSIEKKDGRYDEIAAEISEHNKTADGVNVLRKFAEAKAAPAYADEGDDINRLNSATSAAKVSLTSAFILATTPEGRDNILTVAHEDTPADQVFAESPESVEEVKLFREVLLDAARDAIPDLKFMVSDETYALLSEKTEAYATELKRLSGDMAGEDLDVAISEMLSAFLRAVDDINMAGRSGRVLYAPAVVHMQLTKAYTEGCVLRNSADVDAYRNGGNDSTNERSDGKELEGHDHDEVVQTVRRKTNVFIGTLLASTTGEKTVEADGSRNIELIDTVDYHGLVPGTEYVMSGELHLRNRASGATTFSDGGAISGSQGSTRFIPETPDGTVKVRLVIPAKNFIPQPVVAYEDVCRYDRESGVAEDIILAEHKDINNQNQTLNLTLPAADLVQTGDLIVPAAVAIVMMAGLGYWAARMRRTRRES